LARYSPDTRSRSELLPPPLKDILRLKQQQFCFLKIAGDLVNGVGIVREQIGTRAERLCQN
jgi:hypothetical protein